MRQIADDIAAGLVLEGCIRNESSEWMSKALLSELTGQGVIMAHGFHCDEEREAKPLVITRLLGETFQDGKFMTAMWCPICRAPVSSEALTWDLHFEKAKT